MKCRIHPDQVDQSEIRRLRYIEFKARDPIIFLRVASTSNLVPAIGLSPRPSPRLINDLKPSFGIFKRLFAVKHDLNERRQISDRFRDRRVCALYFLSKTRTPVVCPDLCHCRPYFPFIVKNKVYFAKISFVTPLPLCHRLAPVKFSKLQRRKRQRGIRLRFVTTWSP